MPRKKPPAKADGLTAPKKRAPATAAGLIKKDPIPGQVHVPPYEMPPNKPGSQAALFVGNANVDGHSEPVSIPAPAPAAELHPLQQVETKKPVSSELTSFLEHQHNRFDAVVARIHGGFNPEIQRSVDTMELDQAIGQLDTQGSTLHALDAAQAARDAAEGDHSPQWPALADYDKQFAKASDMAELPPVTENVLAETPRKGSYNRGPDTGECLDERSMQMLALKAHSLDAARGLVDHVPAAGPFSMHPPVAMPDVKIPDQEQIAYSKKLVEEFKKIASDFVAKDLVNDADARSSFTMRLGIEFNMWVLDGATAGWKFLNESDAEFGMNYEVRDGRMKVWFGKKLKDYFFKGKVNADGSTWD